MGENNNLSQVARTNISPKNRAILVFIILTILTLITPIYHDIYRSYLTTPDMDLLAVHDALLLNDGKQQSDVSHTGYVYYLSLSYWFKLCKLLGVVNVDRISELHNSRNPEEHYANLVFAGRIFSALIAVIFSIIFYLVARKLTENDFAAESAAVIFAVSEGLSYQSLVLRTELLSSLFVVLAFLFLLKASRSTASNIKGMFIAGFFSILAILTKVQTFFSLILIASLMVVLGTGLKNRSFFLNENQNRTFPLIYWGGLLFILPAAYLLISSIHIHVNKISGLYQTLVVFGILTTTVTYAYLYGVLKKTWAISTISLLSGLSAGVYVIFLNYDERILLSLANFVSVMKVQTHLSGDVTSTAVITEIINYLPILFSRYLNFDTSRSPETIMQIVIVLFGTIAYLHQKNQRILIICAAFLILPVMLELFFSVRYMSQKYHIYVQPWVILGYALSYTNVTVGQINNVVWKSLYGMVGLLIIYLYMGMDLSDMVVSHQGNANACGFMRNTEVSYIFDKYCVN